MLELDAVNEMLEAIGETPLASLSGTLPADATIARSILTRTTKAILERGWHFNSEDDVEFTPVLNKIAISSSTYCKVDHKYDYYTVYDCNLYDLTEHTDTFTEAVDLDVIKYYTIDKVPEPIARFIVARSSKIFQQKVLGSDSINRDLTIAEREAQADAMSFDLDCRDADFGQSYEVFDIIAR